MLERFLREELDRYDDDVRMNDHEDDALKAVCQALLWICALDEFHRKQADTAGRNYNAARDADPAGRFVRALRYARNRAVHQFTQLVETRECGVDLPAEFPIQLFEIVWRRADDLPRPERPDPPGEKLFRTLLEGEPVHLGFNASREWFSRVP